MNMVEAIKAAGVVGAGGAGFPTYVKLDTEAEVFIINAAECEPLIEVDKYLCRTYPKVLVETALIIARHLKADQICIALKGKYKDEIAALKGAIEAQGADIRIVTMPTFYPAGDEQLMVEYVTGRVVPEQGLPIHVGCVVSNVGTVLSVADALRGVPVDHKVLSVTGAVKEPLLFSVPIGTPVADILRRAGITAKPYCVILGGPMMGRMLHTSAQIEAEAVTKTLGNLLVLPRGHYLERMDQLSVHVMIRQAQSACISCKMCTDLCPRFLLGHEIRPDQIMKNVWREEKITDEKAYIKAFGSAINCCACGVCELFACPMGLSPRKMNLYMKDKLKAKGLQMELDKAPRLRSGYRTHRIPTGRLSARLNLSTYVTHVHPRLVTLQPDRLVVALRQHIGKPAIPVVEPGDHVKRGELLARAGEGLSAGVHAGMDGEVTEVRAHEIVIRTKKRQMEVSDE